MKYCFVITFLLISSISVAQKSIIGNWKIVSVNNGEIYYNFKSDSLSVFPQFGEGDLNESQMAQIKTMTKMLYGNTQLSFDQKGNYKWIFVKSEDTGKFSVDEQKQIIKMDSKNSLGEIVSTELPYVFKNEQLEIMMNFAEPPGKFVLEKI